jgi:hypothetical protein
MCQKSDPPRFRDFDSSHSRFKHSQAAGIVSSQHKGVALCIHVQDAPIRRREVSQLTRVARGGSCSSSTATATTDTTNMSCALPHPMTLFEAVPPIQRPHRRVVAAYDGLLSCCRTPDSSAHVTRAVTCELV